MIGVTKIETWGWQHAIRGMRNPLQSWDKSDSDYYCNYHYDIGPKDLDLMQRLYKGGPEHRKYLRQIFVSMDIKAPLYWWKEFDTYKIGTVANSTSTMHTLCRKDLELSDFSVEHLSDYMIESFEIYIKILNAEIHDYMRSKDKKHWWNVIQSLPSSYNQTRTVTMNYENIYTILKQRSGHKLDEWNDFCNMLLTLPYVREIGGIDERQHTAEDCHCHRRS